MELIVKSIILIDFIVIIATANSSSTQTTSPVEDVSLSPAGFNKGSPFTRDYYLQVSNEFSSIRFKRHGGPPHNINYQKGPKDRGKNYHNSDSHHSDTLDDNFKLTTDEWRNISDRDENVTLYGDKFSLCQGHVNDKYPVQLWKKLGLFEDNYLDHINCHWFTFDPPVPLVHNIFLIFYSTFMVIGCGGNLLVIIMFFRCRSLRIPPNFLIANLAFSDFLMMAKTPIFIVNSFYRGPALGELGCRIYGFVGGLSGTASILTLTCISVERYNVILYPLNPLKRTTPRRALFMILFVWFYAALFSSAPLFGWNNYTSEGYLTSCSFDYLAEDIKSRIFVGVFFCAAFVLPLTVISFSYWKIFGMVRAAGRDMEQFPSGASSKCNQDKSEIKTAKLAASIILLWLLAWTPYATVALLGIFQFQHWITPLVSSIPALFCKMASCINPFMYALNHPKFQKELRSKLCPQKEDMRRSSKPHHLTTSFLEATKENRATEASTARDNDKSRMVPSITCYHIPTPEDQKGSQKSVSSRRRSRGGSATSVAAVVATADLLIPVVSYEKYTRRCSSGSLNSNTAWAIIAKRKAAEQSWSKQQRRKSHVVELTREEEKHVQEVTTLASSSHHKHLEPIKLKRTNSLPEMDDIKDFYF